MSPKVLTFVITVAIVAIVGVMFFVQPPQQTDKRSGIGEFFFDDLRDRMNDVAQVEIRDSSNKVTIKKEDDGWVIVESDNYPAVPDRIRGLLVNISNAKRLEEKTSNPERYSQIDVEDIADGVGKGKQFRLLTADGSELASLIVGRMSFPGSGIGDASQFVRVPGEKASWLIQPSLNIVATRQGWAEVELFSIANTRVRTAEVQHADGEVVRVSKEDQSTTNWKLETTPEGREVETEWRPNELTNALTSLRFDDVVGASRIDEAAEPISVYTSETFDGIRMTAKVFELENGKFVTISAEAVQKEEADEATDEEASEADQMINQAIADEVATINSTVEGWAFKVPQFTIDRLTRRNDFYLKRLESAIEDGPVGPDFPEEFSNQIGDFLLEDRLVEDPVVIIEDEANTEEAEEE